MRSVFVSLVLVTALAGCSKEEKPSAATVQTAEPQSVATQAPTPPPAPAAPSAAEKPVQHVEIQIASVANEMAFDKKTLTVPAGAEVHLVLKNNATMSTLPHNWVLVKTGAEASVAAAGLKRGDPAGYVDVMDRDMLAFTPLAKPGQTTEVTFTAPSEPGTYPYICTMPGHYMMMKGVLTVTP